jgi:hypothetical protein
MKKYLTAPFINVSLITVTLFNIDRCCSLKLALRYYQIVTPKVLKMACLLSWLLGILISYLMFFDPSHPLGIFCGRMFKAPLNAVSYSTKVFQILTISSNLFMYMYMSLSLCTRFRSVAVLQPMKRMNKSSSNCNLQTVQSDRITTRNKDINNGQSIRSQVKVMKKLAVITGFFLLCCTPYFLLQILLDINYNIKSMQTLFTITAGTMFLNSAINPILYVWRFTEARYQLKRILYCWNPEKLRKLEVERKLFFATYDINISTSGNGASPN